ncbi:MULTISPECIES: heme lyase CcmF/NrfE family subunit [Inquilinus]|uniref:Cytochrome c-type biogenesis protein CcmF n=1 Tax=Inquilinus ginsengisoli TaxID=363840 RepID=A0ABU1JNP6_9PROT|nr:heme lyase CcmF/NrfE family subunit [Inquilinus ginsengisoli]MDR6289634.1 cytochrome c-type biogenesis protein CcmF [Inquilinus ginsengisoli]
MIPEIGHYALVLALLLAVIQATLPLYGAARRHPGLMAIAEPAATLQLAAILIAFAALTWAYVVSDFSVATVAGNSHSLKPMLYKVTGVWGNHEGSMLLWVLILALFGASVAVFGENLPPTLKARVLAVQGMIGIGFLAFIILTSNPFLRLNPAPLDGQDMNPLLQDPGLAIHPPFLYLGYVGFSMAFSFAVAALIEGRVDPAWARWVRPWTLAAWSFLTIGIALGSYWAYYELGWGGWWFWDPVENASLMPWMAGTALLHSALVVEKRDALKSWTILLAIVTFGLSLVGTFLVRSGIITSVHAFAVDPERGVFILLLLALTIGGAFALYAIRAPKLKLGGVFAPVSREGALVLNNLLICTATATVFIGTLYPLLDKTVSVGAPYYKLTFVPLMAPVVVAMVVAPLMSWKRSDLPGVLGRLKFAAAGTALVVLAVLWLQGGGPVLALVGIAFGAWCVFGAMTDIAERIRLFRIPLGDSLSRALGLPRSAWGAALAHGGLGIALLGMIATSFWSTERLELAKPGDRIDIAAGYAVEFDGVRVGQGPNYELREGDLKLFHNGQFLSDLAPEKRFYPVARMPTSEVAIHTTLVGDVYVALGEAQPDGRWSLRLYHHPLVPWIWGGALIMAFGGALSLSDRRLRVGAPRRAAARAVGSPA